MHAMPLRITTTSRPSATLTSAAPAGLIHCKRNSSSTCGSQVRCEPTRRTSLVSPVEYDRLIELSEVITLDMMSTSFVPISFLRRRLKPRYVCGACDLISLPLPLPLPLPLSLSLSLSLFSLSPGSGYHGTSVPLLLLSFGEAGAGHYFLAGADKAAHDLERHHLSLSHSLLSSLSSSL
jgi:hypothetical protein